MIFDGSRTLGPWLSGLITKKDDIGHEAFYHGDLDEESRLSWDSYWTDDSWSWVDENEDYTSDYWHDGSYYEDADYPWQDAEQESHWEDWTEDSQPTFAAEESEPAPEEYLDEETQQAFSMKGKGHGKRLGCSICGSRWHTAPSCPVSQGKPSKGKSKGKGKYPRKGYKGKSKSKGKGYGSKGSGKGYGWNKGKGYYGYSEKTLAQSFGEVARVSRPTKTVHFQLDKDDEPVDPPHEKSGKIV